MAYWGSVVNKDKLGFRTQGCTRWSYMLRIPLLDLSLRQNTNAWYMEVLRCWWHHALARRFHVLRPSQIIKASVRKCVTCKQWSTKPKSPMFGQLQIDCVTPGPVFDSTGLDFAGPLLIKYGHVRKPTVVKGTVAQNDIFVRVHAYACTGKNVHLSMC